MLKSYLHFFLTILFSITLYGSSQAQIISEPFEFTFEGKSLNGLIEKPEGQDSKSIVLIIPGYGKTNFVEGGWYGRLRGQLVSSGLTVVLWDKQGCGKSEGTFDSQQPVSNSAEEALAAIERIKELKLAGSENIGLWGLSRAGWICPIINSLHPVDFWISVSGTDDKENFGYLLKSNLLIKGKSEKEAEKLYQAWMEGHKLYCTGADYEDYAAAIQPVREDSICRSITGYNPQSKTLEQEKAAYYEGQKSYLAKGYFDTESGLWVYLEGFPGVLNKLVCPVLALFGEQDSQVDWRKTKALYEATIGINPKANLIVQVFENCNHSLQKCIDCSFREDLSSLNWEACPGYYDAMKKWLKENGFTD